MESTEKRVTELKTEKQKCENKVTHLNSWLVEHYDHPDRRKYMSDRDHWQCKINTIDKKINNLRDGRPELGYGIEIDVELTEQSTIRKSQQ